MKIMMQGKSARWGALGITLLGFVVASGCNRGLPAGYSTAEGRVLVDGQPAEGVLVVLVPQGSEASSDLRPGAHSDSEGKFRLRTYDSLKGEVRDGAPQGEYSVILTWVPQPTEANLEEVSSDRLHHRYRDPAKSEIQVTIAEGENELPVLEVSAARPAANRRATGTPQRY